MIAELREDSKTLAARLREAHGVCEEYEDIATASLIEVWIDETERRTWFLFEAGRRKRSYRALKPRWIPAALRTLSLCGSESFSGSPGEASPVRSRHRASGY
jgi:Ferritin-like domain